MINCCVIKNHVTLKYEWYCSMSRHHLQYYTESTYHLHTCGHEKNPIKNSCVQVQVHGLTKIITPMVKIKDLKITLSYKFLLKIKPSYICYCLHIQIKKITHMWRRCGTPQNFSLAFIDELEKQLLKNFWSEPIKIVRISTFTMLCFLIFQYLECCVFF